KCFPSNEEFIKVRLEEDGSSSRATSSTDSTLPTGPVEIPIRKSMSEDFSSIRISHGRMMYNARKAIRNHQVDFDELIDFTISCSSDIEEKLDKSSDVASVLRVIEKNECSLIDTSLISAVVEEFRVTEAERYIEEYKEKLREFCRSISVTLCLKEKFEANPSLQCETATYVFDWRPDEKKLNDITDILSKTSALSRIRRGMRMEIEELILYLTANKSGILNHIDQNAALAENKREIEYLQEQISSTSVQLLMKREENKKYKTAIKDEISHKEKKLLEDEVVLVVKGQGETEDEEKLIKESENLDTLSSLEMEPWFHENVKDKPGADAILEDFKHIPGAFIVRRNILKYFLSFVIHHLGISEINDEGKINYRISRDSPSFVSIVDLIHHYCLYHINIDQISQRLTVPISKNEVSLTYVTQPWYNKNVSRESAEYMLEREEDGAFLVRPSSEGHNTWAISLVIGNSVCHLKFFGKGGQFETGNSTFDSMVELVDFYKQNPIYADTKLKYPINEEILRQK
uniref:SH2 domain-containing protein n=1 Tax=Amphimedon queenslandica TaxID=400682 RepID=A0A1X7T8W2_AMPQE